MVEKLDSLLEKMKTKVFEANVPTYILDESYHFMGWNKPFDKIVAKSLGLNIGDHAIEFVGVCENRKEAMERSAKVFAVSKTPKTDHEILIFKTKPYGLIEFRKLASMVHFKKTDEIAWVVTLNICNADKLDALLSDMMNTIHETVYNA